MSDLKVPFQASEVNSKITCLGQYTYPHSHHLLVGTYWVTNLIGFRTLLFCFAVHKRILINFSLYKGFCYYYYFTILLCKSFEKYITHYVCLSAALLVYMFLQSGYSKCFVPFLKPRCSVYHMRKSQADGVSL